MPRLTTTTEEEMKFTVFPHPIIDQRLIRTIEADTIDAAMDVVTDENAHSGSSIHRFSNHMVAMDIGDVIIIFADEGITPTADDWRTAQEEFPYGWEVMKKIECEFGPQEGGMGDWDRTNLKLR